MATSLKIESNDDNTAAADRKRKANNKEESNNGNGDQLMVKSEEAAVSTGATAVLCPYLDTIERSALDFDLDISCCVSLERNYHIYCCCVCGKYFRGRGVKTPAYLHSVTEKHFIFLHLYAAKFYCLPDNYEISNTDDGYGALQDIKNALYPKFTRQQIETNLDGDNTILYRDLFGRKYLPGYVGLNNFNKTDYINVTIQALAHVKPLRDYFLLQGGNNNGKNFEYYNPQLLLEQSGGSSKGGTSGVAANNSYKMSCYVTYYFGELIRKIWSHQRFKSHIDPHKFIQAVSLASGKKYGNLGKQVEVHEFLAWLLHQLHVGTMNQIQQSSNTNTGNTNENHPKKKPKNDKKKKKHKVSSIIQEVFQGKVQITKKIHKKLLVDVNSGNNSQDNDLLQDDDRGGSDDEGEEDAEMNDRENNKNDMYEEVVQDTKFLQLTLDISEKPLFRDDDGGLVIPQEPLVTVLKKFDGHTFSDVINWHANQKIKTKTGQYQRIKKSAVGGGMQNRYRLLELPSYLILHLARFSSKGEKNPTIVVFPVKNLDLSKYVYDNDDGDEDKEKNDKKDDDGNNDNHQQTKHKKKKKKKKKKVPPSKEEIQSMSVKQLKQVLLDFGPDGIISECDNIKEKSELISLVENHCRSFADTLQYKYDLVANITHNSISNVGKENVNSDPLQDGHYKCHVQHTTTKQWYEIQDLHVTEIMPQLIGLSESYVLIFKRTKTSSSSSRASSSTARRPTHVKTETK